VETSYGVRGRDQGEERQQAHRPPRLIAQVREHARPRVVEVADPGFEASRRIGDPGAVVVVETGGLLEEVGSVLRPEAEALEVRFVEHRARVGGRDSRLVPYRR
jgi:hypothetical protein